MTAGTEASVIDEEHGSSSEVRLAVLAFRRVSRAIDSLELPPEWDPEEDDSTQMVRRLRSLNESVTSLLTCCNLLDSNRASDRCAVTQLPTKKAAARHLSRPAAAGESAAVLELRMERKDFIRSRYGPATLNEVLLHYADLLNMRLEAEAEIFHWEEGVFLIVVTGDREARESLGALARELSQPTTKHLSGRGRTVLLRLAMTARMWTIPPPKAPTPLHELVLKALQEPPVGQPRPARMV